MRTRSSKEFNTAGEDTKEKEPEAAVAPKKPTPKKGKETTPTPAPAPVVDEAAANSGKRVFTLEDVERAKQYFSEGKRHFLCGSMAEAADSLALASEIFGGFYGERSRECAEVFYYYGRALLDLARKEPDVVTGAVEGTCLDKIDTETEQEIEKSDADAAATLIDTTDADDNMTPDEVREKVLDALDENAVELEKEAAKKAAAKAAGENAGADAAPPGDTPIVTEITTGEPTKKEDGAAADEAMPEEEEETPVVEEVGEDDTAEDEEEGGEENKENKPMTEEETLDEIPNLQLAWEMLDLARVILEKCDDKASQERLADIRLALGEQAMEDEQFDNAISEFGAALDIQSKLLAEDDRRIALSHYNIGVARNLMEEYEQAVESFRRAVGILKLRHDNEQAKLADWKEGGNDNEKTELEADVKELEALIVDIENRIQDCVESRAQTDAAKEAMAETIAKTVDQGETSGAGDEGKVSDVSHLVRKSVKRVSGGDDKQVEEPSKKAKLDTDEVKGENGHGPENGNKVEMANGSAAE